MTHIMIDLDTLSRSSNAAVIGVAAVAFTEKGRIIDSFEADFDIEDTMKYGEVSGEAIKWWLNQSDVRREDLARSRPFYMVEKITALHEFIAKYGVYDVKVWGALSGIHTTILSNLFNKLNLSTPWTITNNRCYTTMRALAPQVTCYKLNEERSLLRVAKEQAHHLVAIVNELNMELK